MTDRETFLKLLKGAGIGHLKAGETEDLTLEPNDVALLEGVCDNVTGYGRFFAVFEFDETGKLTEVHIAE